MSTSDRLGKGLESLIPTDIDDFVASDAPQQVRLDKTELLELPVELVDPNPHQPRQEFRAAELEELASSIRAHGILQPLVVSKAAAGRFELIAGERRLRAAKKAGLKSVPAIVRSFDEQQQLEVAMVENIQRAELNPMELAAAYSKLSTQFNLSNKQIAQRVGKAEPTVINTMRLLNLDHAAKVALNEGKISEGHARALLMCKDVAHQRKLLAIMLRQPITVRQAEDYARDFNATKDPKSLPLAKRKQIQNDLTTQLEKLLSTRVRLQTTTRGGRVVIDYYSDEDLQRIVEAIVD
jgi:ParB family chromosome partitioning protein